MQNSCGSDDVKACRKICSNGESGLQKKMANGAEPFADACAENGRDADSCADTRAEPRAEVYAERFAVDRAVIRAEKNGTDADCVAIFGTDVSIAAKV